MGYVAIYYNEDDLKIKDEILNRISDLDCTAYTSENSIMDLFDDETIENEIYNMVDNYYEDIDLDSEDINNIKESILDFGSTNGLNYISAWDDLDDLIREELKYIKDSQVKIVINE